MVHFDGHVTGGGSPAHRAGHQDEPLHPCVTRQMTQEELEFYGVDKWREENKLAKKKKAEKKRVLVNRENVRQMIIDGYQASAIAVVEGVDEDIIWKRAKQYGMLPELEKNEELYHMPDGDEAAQPDAEEQFPQDPEENEYRYLSAAWLDAIACGLTAGAVRHPGETWRSIPIDEHVARAMRHLNLYRAGDRSEPHIINASMRAMMAYELAREEARGDD